MAAAPAVAGKPKRKGARSTKHAEPEIVPGVTGVQTALDLRSPDKKERERLRAADAAPVAVIRAAHVEPSAGSFAAAEKSERHVIHRSEKGGETQAAPTNAEKPATDSTEEQQSGDGHDTHETQQVARAADAGRRRAIPSPGAPSASPNLPQTIMNASTPTGFRCGMVAIVGRPNVGKSTLMNALVGQKVSITSRKAQTTRHRITGIHTLEDAQYIFVDTPGFQTKHSGALNRSLNRAVTSTLTSVDAILFVIEAGRFGPDDQKVLDLIPPLYPPC